MSDVPKKTDPSPSRDPKHFPVFLDIEHAGSEARAEFDKKLANIKMLMEGEYLSFISADSDVPSYSEDVLLEILDRVEKRRVYFRVFHKCEMGELNEGALLCFWIAKLQPFSHPIINPGKLNARIAVTLFVNTIFFHLQATNQDRTIPKHFVYSLYHALKYRDISKESLMILAESFLDEKPEH